MKVRYYNKRNYSSRRPAFNIISGHLFRIGYDLPVGIPGTRAPDGQGPGSGPDGHGFQRRPPRAGAKARFPKLPEEMERDGMLQGAGPPQDCPGRPSGMDETGPVPGKRGDDMNGVGRIDEGGRTYENVMFGVRLVLPEGFSFYGEEQMAGLNGIGEEQEDEDVAAALGSGQAFFDMAAANEGGSTVNAVIAHAGTPEARALDAAEYLELAKPGLESQLSAAGAELEEARVGAYGDGKCGAASMRARFEAQGARMHEELVCLKAGDSFMTITATAPDEAALDEILGRIELSKG